jgi:PhnB protein
VPSTTGVYRFGLERSVLSLCPEERDMPVTRLNPYLFFNGNAERAMRLYETALGAKTERLVRFGDAPNTTCSIREAKRVMHGLLRLGDSVIMVSDTPPESPVAREGNVEVCLELGDPEDLARRFDALATGGTVTLPVHDAFWGAKFGMLTDAFGIRWMLHCEAKKA